MANKYLHIGFQWVGAPRTQEAANLIETPGVVDDWFKYGGNCWIVYTQYNQTAWAEYLSKILGTYDSVMIYEVTNLNHTNGRLPGNFWDWFNKYRP
jgi:hypothetical protein